MAQASSPVQVIVHAPIGAEKNVGVAIILAVLFGPLGLLYSSVLGGVLLFLISLVLVPITLGLAIPVIWVLCILDAILASVSHNSKLRRQMMMSQSVQPPWR